MREPVHVGRVWQNGDQWVLGDRPQAAGISLESDYDDGTLEVFRLADDELLFVGVRYADDPRAWEVFLADALAAELEPVARLDLPGGELALRAGALPWADATLVRERPGAPPQDTGQPNEEILLLALPPQAYELRGGELERESYGLAVWRLGAAPQPAS